MGNIVVFTGKLVQLSSFTTGGNDAPDKIIGSYFYRNGAGDLCIPSSTIAGSVVAYANRMGLKIADKLSGKYETEHCYTMSAMQVYDAHCPIATTTEIRQMNGLYQTTRTAADKVIFNIETTPRKTQWNLMIEIDEAEKEVLSTVMSVLAFWQNHLCTIGALITRGMGHFRLEGLEVYTIPAEKWISNKKMPSDRLLELISANEIKKLQIPNNADHPKLYHRFKCELSFGQTDDNDPYGLDTLCVGGSEFEREQFFSKVVTVISVKKPRGMNKDRFFNDQLASTDAVLSTSAGDWIIPGSSVKGAVRHYLSAKWRAKEETVRDPNNADLYAVKSEPYNSEIDSLFGYVSHDDLEAMDGVLMISDFYPEEKSEIGAMFLNNHAEDEFAGGVYGSGKFDSVVLTSGKFVGSMLIWSSDIINVEKLITELKKITRLFIGANVTKGSGCVKVVIAEEVLIGK